MSTWHEDNWTGRATSAVMTLPAGTRTPEGLRRSKLVAWLIDRKLGRPSVSAGIHRFLTELNRTGSRPGLHYEGSKPGPKYQRIARVDTNRETGEVISRSATYFVNLQTGQVHEAESWKRPRRWACMDVLKVS